MTLKSRRRFRAGRLRPLACVAAVCLWACSTGGPTDADRELAQRQRATLASVLYGGNPPPPTPSAAEISRASAVILDAAPWERDLLETLYPNDRPLQALAVRDTDADGTPDFRISDYYGRFLEGDTDLDGDGVDNLLDAAPFDRAAGAPAGAGVPAHLDWAETGRPAEMSAAQHDLYARHGILLIERSAEFRPGLAELVDDVVNRVFAATFDGTGRLPTLRVVATAEASLLTLDEDSAGDFAQFLPATASMEIYRLGIEAPPIVQLGFLVHEIGHSIQYALDFSAEEQREIVRRNFAAAANFHALVADYGWSRAAIESDPEAEFALFRPQYIAAEPYEDLYLGQSVDAWGVWLDEIEAQVGETYLTDARVAQRHVLGWYSLSSPWEWYSDHLIAYVYLELLDSLATDCPAGEIERITRSLEDTVAAGWLEFRFENARGEPFQAYLRDAYPIDANDARYLAAKYLPLACSP